MQSGMYFARNVLWLGNQTEGTGCSPKYILPGAIKWKEQDGGRKHSARAKNERNKVEIKLTGTGPIWSRYQSASALINGNIMIDMPNGIFKSLMTEDNSRDKIDHVILTHMHGDHILGLPVWALRKTKTVPPPQEGSIRICVSHGQKDTLESIVRNSFSTSLTEEKTGRYFRWIGEDEFTLPGLKIRRIPVKHGSLPDCSGYLVTDGCVTVGFTGDSCICDGVREIVSSADLVFCDCDLITGDQKHMGINDLRSLVKEYPGVKIVAAHLKDETRSELSRLKPEGITAAADGEIIRVSRKT